MRPSPNTSPDPASTAERLRLQHLLDMLGRLRPGDNESERQAHLQRWLERGDRLDSTDLFIDLSDLLGSMGGHAVDAATTLAVFGRSLFALACADVEREARRAGHADTHRILEPWIDKDDIDIDWSALSVRAGTSPSHLRTALVRLRHRIRQRVDARIAAWAGSPEACTHLRRRLRSALQSDTGDIA